MAWIFRLRKFIVENAANFMFLCSTVFFRSGKLRKVHEERVASLLRQGRSVICPIWHQRLFYYLKVMADRNAVLMVTVDPRLDIVARWCEKLGLEVVRGGSGDGKGEEALQTVIRKCKEVPRLVAHAPDGPSGPPHHVRPGIVRMALATGAAILPTSWSATREFVMKKQWDQKVLPMPGAGVVFVYGEPIEVPENLREEEVSRVRERIGEALTQVEEEARRLRHQLF